MHMHEWMFLRLVVLLLAFGTFVAIAIVTGVRDNHRDSTRQRDRARNSHPDDSGLLLH
jgi:hypothetical protein